MWCVIPVAGRGTRLRPLTLERPKALLDIGGRPLIHHLLDRLTPPVTDLCLVLGESGDAIRAELGDAFGGAAIHYVFQDEPKGVADALLRARGLVSGPFTIVMGDCYYSRALGPYIEAWKAARTDGMVLVEPLGEPSGTPIGLVRGRMRRVVAIAKTADPDGFDYRVAGAFGLPGTALETGRRACSDAPGECELEDVVTDLLGEGLEFAAIPYDGWRRNINTLEDLEAARARHGRHRQWNGFSARSAGRGRG